MAHLSGVSEESVSQDVRDVYERVKKKYGTLLEPVSIAAHNPGMAQCPLQSPHGYSRTKSHRGTRRPAAVAATESHDRSHGQSNVFQPLPRYTSH